MKTIKQLNIVSFDVPYPPNYGGVIDVFYKIVNLHKLGVEIHLHIFEYGREKKTELEKYCSSVSYYSRKLSLFDFFSKLPFIVKTRNNNNLFKNLKSNNFPILFEGLHTSYFINNKSLKNRQKLVRTHNIEHDYYFALAKYEKNCLKKIYFYTEAWKLKFHERQLKKAQQIISISAADKAYFQRKYKNTHLITAFHNNSESKSETGKGEYLFFHGNLEVKENEEALLFLIENVFSEIHYPIIVAGKNPSKKIQAKIETISNIKLISNPEHEKMSELLKKAQIIVLYTFQATGIKLKLLNSLFEGRFCIANDKMLFGTDLDKICIKANSNTEIINAIHKYFNKEFSVEILNERKRTLLQYSNIRNAEKLIKLLD